MAAVVLRMSCRCGGARAQRSEDQARAGAHDVGEPDDDERDSQLGAAADHDGEPGDRQRVPDGDQDGQNGDDGGAPAHRPHLRRDLEARDLDVLADEMAEAERGLARQARHAFAGRGGHRRETPVVAGPANPSDACFSPLITVSMATSLPLSAALASALWSVRTREWRNPPSQWRSMIG